MTHRRDCKFYSIKIVDLRSFLCIRLCSVEPKDPNHPNAKFKCMFFYLLFSSSMLAIISS